MALKLKNTTNETGAINNESAMPDFTKSLTNSTNITEPNKEELEVKQSSFIKEEKEVKERMFFKNKKANIALGIAGGIIVFLFIAAIIFINIPI